MSVSRLSHDNATRYVAYPMKVATKKIGTIIYHGETFRTETGGLARISSLCELRSGSFSSEIFAFEAMMRLLMSCQREKEDKKKK